MVGWRRVLAIGSGVLAVGTVGTVGASFTPGGGAALRSVESHLVSLVSSARPVVDADAGGGGGSNGLGPAHIRINPTVRLTSRITANVHFAVLCGPLSNIFQPYIQAQVSEAVGKTIVDATNETVPNHFTCDGTFHWYWVLVQAQNQPLRAGQGVADVNVQVCGTDESGYQECQNGSASKLVTITK